MSLTEDSYQILGVTEDASLADVKAAYYKLVKKYHPDSNNSEIDAAKKFVALNDAYAAIRKVLSQKSEAGNKYYNLLNVGKDVGKDEVTASYDRLIRECRADPEFNESERNEKIKSFNKAYDFIMENLNDNATGW